MAGLLVLGSNAWAGDGKFRVADGELDLHVLLDAREDITDWMPVFDELSNRLLQATDGQVKLGKVTIYQGESGKDPADIVISPTISGAYTYAYKPGSLGIGAGGSGGRIYLEAKLQDGQRPASLTLIHEAGHWLFGMKDSYRGALQDANNPLRFLKDDGTFETFDAGDFNGDYLNSTDYFRVRWPADAVFYNNHPRGSQQRAMSRTDLMDGPDFTGLDDFFGTSAAGGFSTEHLARRTDTVMGNSVVVWTQQNILSREESSWETIVRNWPMLNAPTTDLTQDMSPPTTQGPEFRIVPALVDFSLILDRSGSMSGEPLDLAKRAGRIVVNMTRESETVEIEDLNGVEYDFQLAGDRFSLTSFSNAASVDFSDGGKVAEMNPGNRAIALGVIDTISAGGATSIGAGLEASLGTLHLDQDAPQAFILLSDGDENTPPTIASAIPNLQTAEVRVYPVGLGDSVSPAPLQSLAAATGGRAFFTQSIFGLPGIFASLYSEVRDENILFTLIDVLGALEGQSESVRVDPMVGAATFLLSWDREVLTFTLESPLGLVYSVDQPQDAQVEMGDGFVFFRILEPEAGDWTYTVEASQPPSQEVTYQVKVFGADPFVRFEAQSDQDLYFPTQSVILSASVAMPLPVLEASVTAEVTRQMKERWRGQRVVTEVTLLDDGMGSDDLANDGIYTVAIDGLEAPGIYEVTVRVDTEGGVTPTPGNSSGIEFRLDPPGTHEEMPVLATTRVKEFFFVRVEEPTADLILDKTVVAENPVKAGDRFSYFFTVTNAGPDATGQVVVTDFLPAEVRYIGDTCGSAYDDLTHSWIWTSPVLFVSMPQTCELVVEALPGGFGLVENTAFVDGLGVDPMTANNSSTASVEIDGSVVEVPILSPTGLLMLTLLMGITAIFALRRRGGPSLR